MRVILLLLGKSEEKQKFHCWMESTTAKQGASLSWLWTMKWIFWLCAKCIIIWWLNDMVFPLFLFNLKAFQSTEDINVTYFLSISWHDRFMVAGGANVFYCAQSFVQYRTGKCQAILFKWTNTWIETLEVPTLFKICCIFTGCEESKIIRNNKKVVGINVVRKKPTYKSKKLSKYKVLWLNLFW